MRIFHSICFFAFAAIAGAQQSLSLADALRVAQNHRPAYEAARLRVQEAHQKRRALGAFPKTSLALGYTSDDEVGGSDEDFVLTQPLDLFGRTSAARATGGALVNQARAGLRRVASDIQVEVVDAYIEAAAAIQLAKSADSIQATLQSLYNATRSRVEGGVAPGIQLTRVGIELDRAKLRSEQRQAELRASRQRLASTMGVAADESVVIDFPDLPFLTLSETGLAKERADLLALSADLQVAEAESRAAAREGSPLLELQARRTPWQQSDARYGLRLQLSIPLFDHGRVRAESKSASLRTNAIRENLADATKQALREIAAAKIEVEATRDQVAKYAALAETAHQLVDRLRPGLSEQATTLLEVIDATRSMREVEEGLVEARHRYAQALSRHLKASGQILEGGSK